MALSSSSSSLTKTMQWQQHRMIPLCFVVLFLIIYLPLLTQLTSSESKIINNDCLQAMLLPTTVGGGQRANNNSSINIDSDNSDTSTTLLIQIPKIIHVIGTEWLQEMNSWAEHNPEYSVEFYNDARCNEFIREHYPQFVFTYNHLRSVRKFDFIRYLIIFHHGGIYADSDITCKSPISNWGLLNTTTFFSGMECIGCNDIGVQIIQWTFGATKSHPILDHVIKNVIANSMKSHAYYDRFGMHNKVIHMTGPSAFSDGIMSYLIARGTCAPRVDTWNDNVDFVICTSIVPHGNVSGVQIFPWYRWGSAQDGALAAPATDYRSAYIPPSLGTDLNAVRFISHGYRASWVGRD